MVIVMVLLFVVLFVARSMMVSAPQMVLHCSFTTSCKFKGNGYCHGIVICGVVCCHVHDGVCASDGAPLQLLNLLQGKRAMA
jgi:hypothetical protein